MPELRRDPVVGYWTIISTERSRRPVEYKPKKLADGRPCPFCEGHERETPGEVYAVRREGTAPNTPGWQVRAILSKAPILAPAEAPIDRYGQGIYDLMDGVGRHELVIESPQHKHDLDELTSEAIEKVIQVYAERFRALETDTRFKYALLFKNHGLVSGVAHDVISHSRSQIIAMPIIPKRAKEELAATQGYFELHDRCVFCDVLRQESKDGQRLVAENDAFFAFCPFAARSPFEMWILPKSHLADFAKLPPKDFAALGAILRECLLRLHRLLDDPPFNLLLHTAPFRRGKKGVYWKTIEEDYHWYFQIVPRLTKNAGFEWGTGIHINPTPPEEAAWLLREVSLEAN